MSTPENGVDYLMTFRVRLTAAQVAVICEDDGEDDQGVIQLVQASSVKLLTIEIDEPQTQGVRCEIESGYIRDQDDEAG